MHKPSIAVIGAALILTVGVGGGAYAVGTISGADIINDTVTTADIKNQTLKLNDLAPATADDLAPRVLISRKGAGAYLPNPPVATVFHSMTVPSGAWLVSVTATAFPEVFGSALVSEATCSLKAPGSSTGLTRTTLAGDDGYATLATQITVDGLGATLVSFECTGQNAGINEVTITAVEASTISDLSP